MGNAKSGALSKELLEDLKMNTKYSEEQLYVWYQKFLNECPTGRISQEQFENIYASFFPDADPKAYAQHVFRSFDANSDGTLDFKEYIVALHLTSSGKNVEKLEWAFALYDVDRNGTITKNEIHEIVKVNGVYFPKASLDSLCFPKPNIRKQHRKVVWFGTNSRPVVIVSCFYDM